MSWLSKKLKNKTLSKTTFGEVIHAIPVAGGALGAAADVIANEARSHKIESTINAAQHLAGSAYDQVKRIAKEQGISELEAAQLLVKRADASFTGWRTLTNNKGWIYLAVGALVLFLLLRRK